jgi:hypothetical protein
MESTTTGREPYETPADPQSIGAVSAAAVSKLGPFQDGGLYTSIS